MLPPNRLIPVALTMLLACSVGEEPYRGSGDAMSCITDEDCESLLSDEDLDRGLEASCSRSDVYDGCNITCMGMG